jgi:hypothetical protein
MLLVLALLAAACTRSDAATASSLDSSSPSASGSSSLQGFDNIQHLIFVVQEKPVLRSLLRDVPRSE